MATNANPKLLECNACGSQIAFSADTCPTCGAPNNWVHPEVARILAQWKRGEVTFPTNDAQNYTIETSKTQIGIQYERPKQIFPFVWRFAAIFLGFLVYIIPGVILGTYWLVKNTDWMDNETEEMGVDFSDGQIVFSDKEFWAPARRSLQI